MPETSTEEIGPHGLAATDEPNPVVGRSDGGPFVKVTHLRPVADPAPPDRRDRQWAGLESPPSEFNAEGLLTIPVRDDRPTTPGAGLRLLRLLAPRVWRR